MNAEDRERILVIEGEPGMRTLLTVMLERNGYQVLTAKDGADAMTVLDKHQPDLILLDITIPGANGSPLCRQIRTQPPTAQTPIVVLSSRSDPTMVDESLAAGADDYLLKPVLTNNLVRCVRINLRDTPVKKHGSEHCCRQ